MQEFLTKLKLLVYDPTLRGRILFTLLILGLFRLVASVPLPGINTLALQQFFASNQFLGLVNIFSGGGLDQFSIVTLGVGPYITASIIMQLLTMMSPRLKALYHEEGEVGRKKFSQYARIFTVPLAILQGFGFLVLLERQGVLTDTTTLGFIIAVLTVSAGSVLLMWLGELITEFGIGNGVSLIIFAGIVSRIPTIVSQRIFAFEASELPLILGFGIAMIAIIAGIVAVTEAERPVPVTYAKRVRGMKTYGGISTYLPLRLNQAGVIPIIFALSILFLPQMLINFLSTLNNAVVVGASELILSFLTNPILYPLFYFLLVVVFTYFYTAITFEPDTIASNLQKNGAFIPGVRPGQSTAQYLGTIVTRITLVGALFLGVVAVLPIIIQAITNVPDFAIGGTALLIVVQVVLDLWRKIDAQLSLREY
jgi:preprotein translocase subunit SecY